MVNKKINSIFLSIIMLFILVFATGCNISNNTNDKSSTNDFDKISFLGDKDIKLKNFETLEELEDFIKSSSISSNYYGGYGVPLVARSDVMLETVGSVADIKQGSVSEPVMAEGVNDFSGTNVQVEGIDEADIIKTDGQYIYTISDKVLFLVDAYPGEDSKVLEELEFDYYPTALFINDDKIVVFGNIYDRKILEKYGFEDYNSRQIVQIYDISDKEDIELINEIVVDGNYREARMIEDNIYLITNSYSGGVYPYPVLYRNGVIEKVALDSIYYYPIPYDYIQYVNVFAFDVSDVSNDEFDLEQVTLVVDNFNDVYMNENNIYITTMEFVNEWEISQKITMDLLYDELSNDDKELIEKIEDVVSDILSDNEKQSKVMQVYQKYIMSLSVDNQEDLEQEISKLTQDVLNEYEAMQFTIFHRIEVDDLDLEIVADGKIPGRLVNQFAMDEKNDVLRVASTIEGRWNSLTQERTKSENRIYTLDMDLEVIDSFKGIAKDERIFSTRFIGDRLYMVTFKQVDPFFVFEIDNEGNIKELGKLKIPGFSRYLHPYDENTIIGIGKDATDEGRTQGLKISLFDVSDVENPKEISKWISDSKYSNSNALYEHKAFLFSKEKNLLVIPAYSYEWVYEVEGDYKSGKNVGYNGALVFDIDKDDIDLKGLVEHESEQYWNAAVERSLYIEELLYTKSRGLIEVTEIDSLDNVNSIKLDYKSKKNNENNEPIMKIY